MRSIGVGELKERLSDGDIDEILIDVRDNFEYKAKHIQDAKNIPLDVLHNSIEKLRNIGTVYVHCQSGRRSAEACRMLGSERVNVVDIEGGLNAWEQAGLPVVGSGKGVIPIIRQVMIVAGSLVFLGVVLGTWVHPYWYALSAFVGAGLMFAGITGFCSMTYVLAWMPWNRR